MAVDSFGKSGYCFSNWNAAYSCHPELYFEPKTVEEIQLILASARQKGKKVRVVGKGHSFSDLACTTDYMISLCHFSNVCKVDNEKLQITVEGGCEVEDLITNVLPSHGLALSVLGVVTGVTVAGFTATGTHGTGAEYGTASSMIVDMDLMTASGEIMHISKEENSELMPAAVLSLGALGVILNVTLQCELAFNLHEKQFPAPLMDVLENLDERVTSSDRFHFEMFPYSDSVVCHHSSHTTEEPKEQMNTSWLTIVGFLLFQFSLWISTFIPRLLPFISRWYLRHVFGCSGEKINTSHKIMTMDALFDHQAMEWAFPREKAKVVLTELQSWVAKSGFPAHFPIFVRFAKKEDIYLSPAYGRDTCFINLIMLRWYKKDVPYEQYWAALERIVAPLGGRPHWGKDHNYGGKDFENLYPKWAEFCRLRQQLDPNGMFLNSHLDRVFGKHSGSSVPSASVQETQF